MGRLSLDPVTRIILFDHPTRTPAVMIVLSNRITPDLLSAPCRLKHPEKVIEFGGQVIGASITPEEDTLYVNVRKWPRGVEASAEQIDELLPISEEVELLVVDLATMDVKEKV